MEGFRDWSSSVVTEGGIWLTPAIDEGADSLRLVSYDIATGRESLNVEVFRFVEIASPTLIIDGVGFYLVSDLGVATCGGRTDRGYPLAATIGRNHAAA